MYYQDAYMKVLFERYMNDDSFQARVRDDIASRMRMYRNMYSGVVDKMGMFELEEFLTVRTIRTMAQYLTLGRLISEASVNPIIINHPTRNINVFNDRNKFLLPEDELGVQKTVPVVEMNVTVY